MTKGRKEGESKTHTKGRTVRKNANTEENHKQAKIMRQSEMR
jgi:hypothetical protein